MYILLCGYPPFNGPNDKIIFQKILEGKFVFPDEDWSGVSKSGKDVIKKMLTYNFQTRASSSEILMHDWFKLKNHETPNLKTSAKVLANMRAFTTSSKLQKAIMLYIISCFDLKEEKDELLKTFKALDLDNDGQLSKDELMAGYTKTMGEDDAKREVERIMDTVDVNQTGNIDFTEFLLATVDHKKLCDKDKLGKVFKIIDTDASGSISRREIKEFFSMGDTKDDKFAMELIEEIDKNNDGEIDEVEFYQMMGNVMEKL